MAKYNAKKKKQGKEEVKSGNGQERSTNSGGSQLYMYANSEQSLKDSARLAFSDVLGLPDDLGALETEGINVQSDSSAISIMPGIMSLMWGPFLGTTEKHADTPVNVAALNAYSYVRHANSGHANYDHTDFMMVVLAIASYFAWLGALVRLYGTMMIYNQKNRYMSRALVRAMGFDFDDLVGHINDLRAFINLKIAEASILWIPNTMPIVARWYMLNSYVYADSADPKAQLYVFNMTYTWKFQNRTQTTGSSLARNQRPAEFMTFEQIITYTNDLARVLISDEDIGIMCGDILKAFGSDKIYGLAQIPDEYVVLPVYDQEVLLQIHNSVAVGFTPGDVKQDLTSDPGFIYQDWPTDGDFFPREAFGIAGRRIFDLRSVDPDPSIVMIASRLSALYEIREGSQAKKYIMPIRAGSELVYGYQIWTSPANYVNVGTSFMSTTSDSDRTNFLNRVAVMSQFEYAPMLYGAKWSGSDSNWNYQFTNVFGDIDNYTTVGRPELEKMHRTALYTEFGVPYI